MRKRSVTIILASLVTFISVEGLFYKSDKIVRKKLYVIQRYERTGARTTVFFRLCRMNKEHRLKTSTIMIKNGGTAHEKRLLG